ncbi:HET-domain-containing protein [Hypoxylon cercidicola]|nr:HET-domain-containing protein [Hypoxylon cercidicola]
MRFLKALVAKETGTLQVVEKTASQVPQYAILSHTWEEDEVKFEDIESGRANDGSPKTPAAEASLSKLSAELSEAINSMFAWYRDAAVCYAFLLSAPDELGTVEARAEFAGNRWFLRGFTLQELLAPAHVIFFSGRWVPIGEKRLLCGLLAEITGVDADILRGDRPLTSASVARRMSWAAKRVTTRPEDSAYCLMGIFSVNMPMLYGEGAEKAFIRLQEETMKESDDQSLFAWVNPSSPPDAMEGLLASSPSFFSQSKSIVPYQDWEPRAPYAVTNRGLRIDLHLTACGDNIYAAALDCPVPPDYKDSSFLALYLLKLSDKDEQFARVKTGQFASMNRRGHLQTVYVRQKPHAPSPEGAYPYHLIQLRSGPSPDVYKPIRLLYPAQSKTDAPPLPARSSARSWVPARWPSVFLMGRKPAQLSVAVIFERDDGERLAVMIGTMSGFDIAFNAHELDSDLDWDVLTFEYMESKFEAPAAGRFEREYHSVSVSASPVIQHDAKYYMVDIVIEAVRFSLREIIKQTYNTVTGSGHGDAGTRMSAALPALPKGSKEHAGEADGKDKKPTLWKWVIQSAR